ncbi:hypothetical protein P5V15_015157 [Pogonomyrmex californicus]
MLRPGVGGHARGAVLGRGGVRGAGPDVWLSVDEEDVDRAPNSSMSCSRPADVGRRSFLRTGGTASGRRGVVGDGGRLSRRPPSRKVRSVLVPVAGVGLPAVMAAKRLLGHGRMRLRGRRWCWVGSGVAAASRPWCRVICLRRRRRQFPCWLRSKDAECPLNGVNGR